MDTAVDTRLDLRAFLKLHEQSLHAFIFNVLGESAPIDEMMAEVVSKFSDRYQKYLSTHKKTSDPMEIDVLLFQVVEAVVRREHTRVKQLGWTLGRDTRLLVEQGKDLLQDLSGGAISTKLNSQILARVSGVDYDYRLPLVLRDIMHFEDEKACRVLGLRWGIYRHRLHRGRTAFVEALRGRSASVAVGKKPTGRENVGLV